MIVLNLFLEAHMYIKRGTKGSNIQKLLDMSLLNKKKTLKKASLETA